MLGIIFNGPSLHMASLDKSGYRSEVVFLDSVSQSGRISKNAVSAIHIVPPASEGEIYQAALLRPCTIGLIDGYFENVPSVWHKEILFAMSQGIHVLGAASMGALRAAELQAFGMRGVGPIFDAFACNVLDQDDEVTVVHGPKEMDYISISDAMVNIRRTVDDALRGDILDEYHAQIFLKLAKSLFYKERSYEAIFQKLGQLGGKYDSTMTATFKEWLKWGGKKDQKQEDALSLIKEVDNLLSRSSQPFKPLFDFENTMIWRKSANLEKIGA